MARQTHTLLRRSSLSALALLAMAGQTLAQDTKTITIATHYNAEQMAPLTACFDQYEAANPGITIEFQQASYADFLQTILTSRAGGTSPDIYNIYSIWAPQLVRAQALATPPQNIIDMVNANYAPATTGAATINGQLYGIPTELSVFMLVYNKMLFEEAGIAEPPATWPDLVEAAKAITKTNDQNVITTAGYAFGPSVSNAVHPFYALMYAKGVSPFSDDYMSTNLTSPEAVQTLTDMSALFSDGITSNANVVGDMGAGAVGMAIMANWNEQNLRASLGDNFDQTIGVAPIPSPDPENWKTMLYTFFWAVDSSSDVQPEAWALLEWLNTAQTEGGLSCTGEMLNALGALTGNNNDLAAMDGLDDAFSQPYVQALNDGRAVTQPNTIAESEIERILRGYIEQAWAGTLSPTDALNSANAEIQAILEE